MRNIILGVVTLLLFPIQIIWAFFLMLVSTIQGVVVYILFLLGIAFDKEVKIKLWLESFDTPYNKFWWWIVPIRDFIKKQGG